MSDKKQLTQREWDRIVGIGKTHPPAESKKDETEYVVVPLSPFTNHQPTYDRYKKSNDTFNKNEKDD